MSLINRPNQVPHLQRLYQVHTNTPIYLRRGGDKPILIVYASLLTVGLIGSLYGSTKMARGVKE
ncbi:hypothetical protein BGZ94_002846 [Podila epigama]|nr:hypothetical protein BGZ94_002846 [Podila epigama]